MLTPSFLGRSRNDALAKWHCLAPSELGLLRGGVLRKGAPPSTLSMHTSGGERHGGVGGVPAWTVPSLSLLTRECICSAQLGRAAKRGLM